MNRLVHSVGAVSSAGFAGQAEEWPDMNLDLSGNAIVRAYDCDQGSIQPDLKQPCLQFFSGGVRG